MKKLILATAALLGVASTPAFAAETVIAPFNVVDTATTQTYSGTVKIQVTGTGFSLGRSLNDAFYFVPSGTVSTEGPGYYQLAFSTSTLQPFQPGNAIVNAIGSRPTYDGATHTYTFLLNTGLTTPGQLHFGVTDGNFGDNGGYFKIGVNAGVPEPATWGMMLLGFGMVGFGLRSRRKQGVRVTYA